MEPMVAHDLRLLVSKPRGEETLQQVYGTISDKPEKMVKYENVPP